MRSFIAKTYLYVSVLFLLSTNDYRFISFVHSKGSESDLALPLLTFNKRVEGALIIGKRRSPYTYTFTE
jgi:hypothetical protein